MFYRLQWWVALGVFVTLVRGDECFDQWLRLGDFGLGGVGYYSVPLSPRGLFGAMRLTPSNELCSFFGAVVALLRRQAHAGGVRFRTGTWVLEWD